jgi:archaeosortase A (PGF-CTERM-specific)
MVAFLFSQLPHLILVENNFLYPLIAVLALPFLAITIRSLLAENTAVMRLTVAAAVAFLIYAPFEYIAPLGGALISVLVAQILLLLEGLQHPAMLIDWNMLARNGFRIEIILACTGIQSIAIMLGVAAAVPTTLRQKIGALLLVVPTIYVLNTLRNVFVILAYSEQWFPFLPEIAGNGEYGYESFFWAHNVLSELGALVLLVAIAYGLFMMIPALAVWAGDLFVVYKENALRLLGRDEKNL